MKYLSNEKNFAIKQFLNNDSEINVSIIHFFATTNWL